MSMRGIPVSVSSSRRIGRNSAALPLATVSEIRTLNLAMREAFTASTVGRSIGSILWRVARSIAAQQISARAAR